MTLFPNKGMTAMDFILRQWFPAEFQYNCSFKIRLTTVVSPSNFWIQFDDPQHIEELLKLEARMNIFYNEFKEEALFRNIEEIRNSRYGVVEFASGFRRISISSLDTYDSRVIATVFHCDHGLLTRVDVNNLYRLHSRFAYFPQQAIWACLSNINPVDDSPHWASDVCWQFANSMRDKKIQAKVTGFSKDILKVHLILEDITHYPIEVNLNDNLVNLGLAKPGPTMIHDT